MNHPKTNVPCPFLGAAYYPEDWPEDQMAYDIPMMKQAGITVVRIGEFAWHKMEPKPGKFQFQWLHRVIDRLKEAGIAVILGTPTATPPRWLSKLHPDILVEDSDGGHLSHGGRRHCCSNNPHYREYSARIVREMAKEFGQDKNVIGWQIDNEIYQVNDGCFCPHCRRAFVEKLKEKFGAVDRLNESWNLNLFSQWYDSFEDIPAPSHAWHNPHLIMEWNIFQGESHVDFVSMQADILHEYTKVPVGTDTMPFNGINYRDMLQKLDIAQFNHYNTPENLHACALWFDYLRTLKDRPFWNTETAACWNGSVSIGQSLKPEGYNRVNSWMPIALGGEANMYWLWRTHWAGHELMHGAVIDTCGRPMVTFGEVQEVAQSYQKASELITNSKVCTEVALHFTSLNWNMFQAQPILDGFSYPDTLTESFYQPIIDSGLRPDVIDAEQDLSSYRLVFSPLMMTLEDHGLEKRIGDWVTNGGTWIVGPLSDIRNQNGAKYIDRYFGLLEELSGTKWLYGIPDQEGRIETNWKGGSSFSGGKWYDVFEDSAENTLVFYTKGHSAIVGKSAVVCRKVGKGHVILLGTIPSKEDMEKIITIACDLSGIQPVKTTGSVLSTVRKGEKNGLILIEYGNRPAFCELSSPMKNLLTGETCSGLLRLAPYEVAVLEEV